MDMYKQRKGNFVGTEAKTKGRYTSGIFQILHETKREPTVTYSMRRIPYETKTAGSEKLRTWETG